MYLSRALLTLGLLCGPAGFTQAASSHGSLLEIVPGASHLRFALPDEIYAAGSTPDFSHWQLTDTAGNAVDFAICASYSRPQTSTRLPLMAIPELARPKLAADGSIDLSLPPGARSGMNARSWLLDLREVKLHVQELHDLPAIKEVRRSPNLQQWSAPVSFTQDGATLRLDLPGGQFIRLELLEAQAQTPDSLRADGLAANRSPIPQWFAPPQDSEQRYQNPRRMPIMGARLNDQAADQAWRLFSRQGDWDAWKPHGRVMAGKANEAIFFSAVTDPQWRVEGSNASLELAHMAYELRLPRTQPDQTLFLRRQPRADFGPNISCRSSERLSQQDPEALNVRTDDVQSVPSGARSLRGHFLLVVFSLGLLGYFVARYRKHARSR